MGGVMVAAIDGKKQYKALYTASAKEVTFVDVPAFVFLMLDGRGDPNNAEVFGAAMQKLYAVAFALKFAVKKGGQGDYAVMPLEGVWWMEGGQTFDWQDRSGWRWTLMIHQPPPVTAKLFETVRAEVATKKGLALEGLRFETFAEGKAAQILHVGPYATEMPTVERLHQGIAEAGYAMRGKHHEIYLGDPRRAAPEKLKTILRQPVSAK